MIQKLEKVCHSALQKIRRQTATHRKKDFLKIQEYTHEGANLKLYIPEFFNFKLYIPEYSPI
jgi:hypothetical protein